MKKELLLTKIKASLIFLLKLLLLGITIIASVTMAYGIIRWIDYTYPPYRQHEDYVAKPNIYLYPESTQDIGVTLDFKGTVLNTYPIYQDNGWHVTAEPNGRITDQKGNCYPYLFWDGVADVDYDISKGFIIAKEDTVSFLEEKLTILGLNDIEKADFITFWGPRLAENPYNYITFQTKAYTDMAKLTITPKPDTLIRVFMAYEPLQHNNYDYIEQELTPVTRKGYTVVEWGGGTF